LNELEQQLNDLEIYIKKQREIIKDVKIELEELQHKLIDKKIINYKLQAYRNIISDIRLNIPSLAKPNEKLMSIVFNSFDENIHYSVICKSTDQFLKIESLLYEKYPQYKYLNKDYFVNGVKIDITKNLKDNNIKDSDIITLKTK
jgi:hypothetical protein